MGVRQLLLRPELPSCEDCKAWWYDHDWELVKDTEGNPCERPKPVTEEDCRFCDKTQFCFQDMTDYNLQCFDNYTRMKVTGAKQEELEDNRCCRNVTLIKHVEQQAERFSERKQTAELISSMLNMMVR